MWNLRKSPLIYKTLSIFVCSLFLMTFTGCARYSAVSLSNISYRNYDTNKLAVASLSPLETQETKNLESCDWLNSEPLLLPKDSLILACKVFNTEDCMHYLDRNVLEKGYQPIQIQIENNSAKSFSFSPDMINIPLATAEEVAHRVHTSTATRASLYGIGALLLWPLVIPAIVDGIRSHEANQQLDVDFNKKIAKQTVISPFSSLRALLFVPAQDFEHVQNLTVTLLDSKSGDPVVLTNPVN